MTDTLELATRLRSLDTTALAHVIEAHGTPTRPVTDYFDLAEHLLSTDSIQRALSALDRCTLASLAGAAIAAETPVPLPSVAAWLSAHGSESVSVDAVAERLRPAVDLCLVELRGDAVLVYDRVRQALNAWPEVGLPSAPTLVAEPRPEPASPMTGSTETGSDAGGRSAAHAFATVTAVAELVASVREEPARELQRGGLAQPDERRLAAAARRDTSEVAGLVGLAERAGLLALEGREWLVTPSAAEWLAAPTSDRWRQLAEAWRQAVPTEARGALHEWSDSTWGTGLLEALTWERPANPGLLDEIATLLHEAESLGLTIDGHPTSHGLLVLEGEVSCAAEALLPLLPAEVDQVYVQHDLTLVAPGPLAPHIDARLRGMAELESRVPASTYRVTPASVNRAIAGGETAATMSRFLTGISLTGIPQPLEYLISEASERYGRVRVAPAERAGTGSAVHSDDRALLDTLEVDQTLAPLGLHRESSWRLVSRQPRDVVYWALIEARYPAVAEDLEGARVTPARERVAAPAEPAGESDAARLAARLIAGRGEHDDESAGAWIARQLEVAIRTKASLIVSIRMPDGTVVERAFEPIGVSGGRVRGRDRDAGVERTFPLSHVESVRATD